MNSKIYFSRANLPSISYALILPVPILLSSKTLSYPRMLIPTSLKTSIHLHILYLDSEKWAEMETGDRIL